MYKRILIATDGSELSAKGLAKGLELAAQLGAHADIVHRQKGDEDPVGERMPQVMKTKGQTGLPSNHCKECGHRINQSRIEQRRPGSARIREEQTRFTPDLVYPSCAESHEGLELIARQERTKGYPALRRVCFKGCQPGRPNQ